MKKTFTFISCLFILHGFSQTSPSNTPSASSELSQALSQNVVMNSSFEIVIETMPTLSEEIMEMDLDLKTKGIYSFKLHPSLKIPDDYSLIIQDSRTGNSFDLSTPERHCFSVNRAMFKNFTVQLLKNPPLTQTQQTALNSLLF